MLITVSCHALTFFMVPQRPTSVEEAKRPPPLTRRLTEVEPISDAGIEEVHGILRRGHLFRYGETQPEGSFVRQLEKEMASLFGARYAVACNSGGSAIFLALAASGVHRNSTVLMNAFTLSPVPGAVHHAGAKVAYVDVTEDLVIDLDPYESRSSVQVPGSSCCRTCVVTSRIWARFGSCAIDSGFA